MEQKGIILDEVFEAIKKKWLMIVSITLIFTIISALLNFFVIKPKYEASTKVFVGKDEGENSVYNASDVALYQQLMKTYAETIKTKDLIDRALKGLKVDIDSSTVLSTLSVEPISSTQILTIKYTDENPKVAKVIVENITNEFTQTAKEMISNGNIKVIQKVQLPEEPISPNKKVNIVVAFLLGIMMSLGLVFLLEFLDNTFKNKEQLERELNIPVIGAVPATKEF